MINFVGLPVWWQVNPAIMATMIRRDHSNLNTTYINFGGRPIRWPKNQPALVNKIVGNSLKKVWLGHLMLAPAPLPSTNSINPIWLWWSQLKQDETNEVNCKHKDLSKIDSSDIALSREINCALFYSTKSRFLPPMASVLSSKLRTGSNPFCASWTSDLTTRLSRARDRLLPFLYNLVILVKC